MTDEQREAYRKKKAQAKKEREKTAKMMDLQYFLEMVDSKVDIYSTKIMDVLLKGHTAQIRITSQDVS